MTTGDEDDPLSDDATGSRRLMDEDELVDEMSRESFPTSDPPSTWAGEDPSR